MPGFPDLTQPLADEEIELHLSAERDIPEVLLAYQDDPQLHLALGEPRPPSGAELGRRAERSGADRVSGVGVVFAIHKRGSDVCCGEVRVQQVQWESRQARLVVWVAPRDRGQGVARRSLALGQRWLDTECGLAGSC